MAAQELEENPLLLALHPDREGHGWLSCDALIVPECSVFAAAAVTFDRITEEFVRHHMIRYTQASGKSARRDFRTSANVVGMFGDDRASIIVGSATLKIVRRLSADIIRSVFYPDEGENDPALVPPRRTSSSLLRRSSSMTQGSASAATAGAVAGRPTIPDVFIVDASLYPLRKLAPDRVRSPSAIHSQSDANSTADPNLTGGFASNANGAFSGTFADFQQHLLTDRLLRGIAKQIKNFISRVTDGAKDGNPVPREEVRNFIHSTAHDVAEHWTLWSAEPPPVENPGSARWVVELREHCEKYICMKLYDALLLSTPDDVEFAAHREMLLASGDVNLPEAILRAASDSQRRTLRRAVETFEEISRWKAPAEKLVALEKCVVLLRQCIGQSLVRSASPGEPPVQVATREAIETHLPTALRLCVLHQACDNPLAHLAYIDACRSKASFTPDSTAIVKMVREAIEFWTTASPETARKELADMADLLVAKRDAAAAAAQGPGVAAQPANHHRDAAAPAVGVSPLLPVTNGGATCPPVRNASMSLDRITTGGDAASPAADARSAVAKLMQDLNRGFERADAMPEGALGRLPLDRLEVLTADELQRRAEWDKEQQREQKAAQDRWKEELALRERAEADVARAEQNWLDARATVQRTQENKAAELDSMDETRLAMWEAELIRLSALTDDAYDAAKAAWTKFGDEVERNNTATTDHYELATQHLDEERAELRRRAEVLTSGHQATAARLQELHAGLEECLRSFNVSRIEQQRWIDMDREKCAATLEEGLRIQKAREAELEQRERALEERRRALEGWVASRESDLQQREENLTTQLREREAAAEAMRRQLLDSLQTRNDELELRENDLQDRELRLAERYEALKNDLAAREEVVKLRQSAYEAHAVELRDAIQSEVRTVEMRVRTSEAASREAREAAERRLAETKRASAAAEAALKERSAALDRRQAEMERRQRVTAISEERSNQTLEQRTREVLRRAEADRQTVADIQANLKSKSRNIDETAAALEQRRKEMEAGMERREAAAAAKIAAMRTHCRNEFHEAVRILKECDAVEGIDDFRSLALKDFENLWSTMVAFRKVKSRFIDVVRQFEQLERSVDSSNSQPTSPTTSTAAAGAQPLPSGGGGGGSGGSRTSA